MDMEAFEGALFESGVDRLIVGGVCRYVLPPAHRLLMSAWRRSRPKLAAGWTAVKAAPWRTAFAALATAWIAGSFGTYALTGGDVSAPLWAQSWFGSVSLAVWGCAAWQGWLAVRWTVRHTRRLMA